MTKIRPRTKKIVNQELFTLKKYSNKDLITNTNHSSLLDLGYQAGRKYRLAKRNNDTIRYFSFHDRQREKWEK